MVCAFAFLLTATPVKHHIDWLAIVTLIFAGLAACGGMISAVYSARVQRQKADRELLASKLERLYVKLMEEVTQTNEAVHLVAKAIEEGTPLTQIYADNEDRLRPVWSEPGEKRDSCGFVFPRIDG